MDQWSPFAESSQFHIRSVERNYHTIYYVICYTRKTRLIGVVQQFPRTIHYIFGIIFIIYWTNYLYTHPAEPNIKHLKLILSSK